MEIRRLAVGVVAPLDADCIRIEQELDGSYKMTASALCARTEDQESVSIVDGPLFASAQQAEEAGIAWAHDVGAEQLYICVGTLERPLQLIESDRPL